MKWTTGRGRTRDQQQNKSPILSTSITRIGLYGWATTICSAMLLLGFFRAGAWLIDDRGQSKLTDFFLFWSAGYQASHGAPALAYDLAAIQQISVETIHSPVALTLAYPPPVLFVFAPLGLAPYVPAAIIWIAATFCLYLVGVGAIIPRFSALAAAAAAPGAWWGAYTVQTGFLTAALIGVSLVLMERRKIAAGIVLSLLLLKPQFEILFPIALIAACQWRVLVSAIITTTTLVFVSLIVFGTGTWIGFFQSLLETGRVNLVRGNLGWSTIESLFGFVRSIGGSAELAWTFHAVVATTVSSGVCWLCRRGDVSHSIKAAAISLAAFVVTPYVRGYDLVGLAIPATFLVRDSLESGFLHGECTTMVGLFMGSCLLVSFGQPLPCGPALTTALGILVWLHVRRGIARHQLSRSVLPPSSRPGDTTHATVGPSQHLTAINATVPSLAQS